MMERNYKMNTTHLNKKKSFTFPSAAQAYYIHGVAQSKVRWMLQNLKNIPLEYQDLLSYYNLLYWSPEYFIAKIKDGTITHNEQEFQIIYHNCSPAQLRQYSQVRLSFRTAVKEYKLESYVLVTLK